eukprot:m.695220 g.695220  ORF g.695220 m.695220 type:complete len:75 (+) comp22887_c0_seq2:1696-1920(+)
MQLFWVGVVDARTTTRVRTGSGFIAHYVERYTKPSRWTVLGSAMHNATDRANETNRVSTGKQASQHPFPSRACR